MRDRDYNEHDEMGQRSMAFDDTVNRYGADLEQVVDQRRTDLIKSSIETFNKI